ncbi:UNVERIFIED_CONTAM: hypothetical protein K2H54_005361 [Gekko kuhli]
MWGKTHTSFRHKDPTSHFPKATWRMALRGGLPTSHHRAAKSYISLTQMRTSTHSRTVCITILLNAFISEAYSQSSKHRQPGIDIYLQRDSVQNIKRYIW